MVAPVIGKCVLLRLADQYTLAAVSAVHDAETADLRAFCLYADGTLGVVELAMITRGPGVNQWSDPPWPAAPTLGSVAGALMPAGQIPNLPPQPLMVIIRW